MNQQVTEKHLVNLVSKLVLDTYNRMENPLDSFERDPWKKGGTYTTFFRLYRKFRLPIQWMSLVNGF